MEKKRAGAKTLLGKDAILLHQPLFETPFPSQNFPFGKCSKMSLMDENSRNKRYSFHLVSNDKNSHRYGIMFLYQIVVAMQWMHIFKDLDNCMQLSFGEKVLGYHPSNLTEFSWWGGYNLLTYSSNGPVTFVGAF